MEALLRSDSVEAGTPNVLGLVEGNRGLFDGLDVEGSCSTAELARALDCPIPAQPGLHQDDPHGGGSGPGHAPF